MKHPDYEQLNDWIDGALSDDVDSEITRHCAECAGCAESVASLRELRASAQALPRTLTPPADFWSAIQSQTTRKPHVSRWTAVRTLRYPLAAAAVLVIALTSAITFMIARREQPAAVAVRTAAPTDVQLAMHRAEADYTEAVRDLERLVAARRSTMDTATLNLLNRHIKLIDDAIKAAKQALAQDPENEQLPYMITGAYERKVKMLKRALGT